MSKWLLIAIVFVAFSSLLHQQTASAHVLLRDDSQQFGAVLHITPDDDPIAGEPAKMYFDVQNQMPYKETAMLTIINLATNADVTVPVSISTSSLVATYTFPDQGVYRLSLTIVSEQRYTFTYEQLVSRGQRGTLHVTPTRHPLALLALVTCGATLLIFAIIGFNRRQAITRRSSF
ncbi:MAG: hypothetical protein ABIR91_01885 [Candidatus Saccharimonadales bacterium]